MNFEKIAIIGAGIMGHSIALIMAIGNKKVLINDLNDEVLEKAKLKIFKSINLLAENNILSRENISSTLERIGYSSNMDDVKDADLIIEAVPERLDIKKSLYNELANISKKDAVWATNTSGMPINQLATLTDRPDLFVGTHFFMPAHLVPLVEIVQGEHTKIEVVKSLMDLMSSLGKSPVHVKIDLPGFIGNRLQHALAREAMSLLQKGVASMQDIDTVVKTSLAIRLLFTGPLEQRDLNGLDTHLSIAEYLYKDLENSTVPLPILSEKVAIGNLGLKTGKGFYNWSNQSVIEITTKKNQELINTLKFLNLL